MTTLIIGCFERQKEMKNAIIFTLATICQITSGSFARPVQGQEDKLVSPYFRLTEHSQQSIRSGWLSGRPKTQYRETNPYKILAEGVAQETREEWACKLENCDFYEVIHKQGNCDKNIVIMFSAEWCVSCKRMYPIITKLRDEGYLIYVFDLTLDRFKGYDTKYNINVYPTFVIFDKGKEVKRNAGLVREKWFRENLKTRKEQENEQ